MADPSRGRVVKVFSALDSTSIACLLEPV
uniref:Uncharacterized protein n=1 Tax=Anguilla anguilla TaxID=7936 RepID=A0A0E9S035_ANGAN